MRFSILPFTVALCTLSLPQLGSAQSVDVGAGAGVTFSTIDVPHWKSLTGFTASASLGYRLTGLFVLRPALAFAQKGARRETVSLTAGEPPVAVIETTLKETARLNYLELQLPVSLAPELEGSVLPELYVGPALALELSCRGEQEVRSESFDAAGESLAVSTESASGNCGEIVFTSTKSLDFGVLFGGGVSVRVGRGAIRGDLRYVLGLVDVGDGDGGSFKNRSLQILLGYAHYLSPS